MANLTNDEESKHEITRNPFDSQLYEKENFPLLDSSVFINTETPKRNSANDGAFRWSIDQIALLKPAEMDLNPNQEYSIVYDKQEDEENCQRKVDEYFKNVLLPSPWLEDRNQLKRVTFSPHAATHYISRTKETNELHQVEETLLSDACCQTELTFPMQFDLHAILGKSYYSYYDESGEARALMISSLRRKLFVHEIRTPIKSSGNPPVTPNYTTSSPSKCNAENTPKSASLSISDDNSSVSSIKSGLNNTSSEFFSPVYYNRKQASNCGSPQEMSSVELSPIEFVEEINIAENDSFLQNTSFNLDITGGISESNRAVHFKGNISPIGNNINVTGDLDTLDLQESRNLQESCLQNIKESTATNTHLFGSFDVSSITENSSRGVKTKDACEKSIEQSILIEESLEDDDDDEKPDLLDITDLMIEEKPCENISNPDIAPNQNPDINAECLKAQMKIPLKSGIVTTIASNITPTRCVLKAENTPNYVLSSPRVDNIENVSTPLKGILKHRSQVTPTRTNLKQLDNTEYNTAFNRKQLSSLVKGRCLLTSPFSSSDSLTNRFSSGGSECAETISGVSEFSSTDVIQQDSLCDDAIYQRALLAMKKATTLSRSFEIDDGKGRTSCFRCDQKLAGEVDKKTDKMECASYREALKEISSNSPLLSLDQLSLYGPYKWKSPRVSSKFHRSFSWPYRTTAGFLTPRGRPMVSRTPKSSRKDFMIDPVTTAYKDFLPSPLK